jgi:NADPH-dependent 2,4-dienoyl-CoA reductase/sulfur reductase-like enzyme/rhodanese-related sulfurtransferase/two-component sensor histidine kinase
MSKDEIRDALLKVGAHQLRSPISTIQTQLNIILQVYDKEMPGKMKRLVEGASKKSEDMLSLINDLLDMGQLENEHVKEEFTTVRLEKLFLSVIEHLSGKAEFKEIDLQIDKKDILPIVWGHRSGLKSIFYNLIENAIKYTPRGGKVTVKTNYDRRGVLHCEVKDTGIGIPCQEIKGVFSEFYRASNAKEEAKIGTGLGLAIVAKAIEVHGGEIKCESNIGQGTAFKFSIALAKIEEEEAKLLEQKKQDDKLKIVIIGGRTAGPKAAAKARRMNEDASITIIEKDESLSYAGCGLPYYISGMVSNLKSLMTTNDGDIRDPDFFRQIKEIEVLNRTRALSIDRENKEILIENFKTKEKNKITYDKLILATGSKAIIPRIKGINKKGVYSYHKVEDAEGLKKELKTKQAKDVIIIGGGLLGAETAEALSRRGARVTIIEEKDQILIKFLDKEMADLVKNYFESKGIKILLNNKVELIEGHSSAEGVVANGNFIPADLVILSTGLKPEVRLAKKCGLTTGITGGIKINKYLQTSDPHIYAIGDCVENTNLITGKPVYTPFGSIATRQGRVAGINATGGKEKFSGVIKTIIMKFFDYNIGSVGLNEEQLKTESFDPVSIIVPGPDKDHFFPSAKLIYIKLTGDRNSKNLLGAQIIGRGDILSRLNTITTAISAKMKISDISKLDLAYAPPYSSAMDIIITAANVLNNKIDGNYNGISPAELKNKLEKKEDIILLDIRSHSEYDYDSINGSSHIPLNSLRGRLHQLPKDREIIICCRSGVNSYEALRIFKSHGFNNAKVLDGGIVTFRGENADTVSLY